MLARALNLSVAEAFGSITHPGGACLSLIGGLTRDGLYRGMALHCSRPHNSRVLRLKVVDLFHVRPPLALRCFGCRLLVAGHYLSPMHFYLHVRTNVNSVDTDPLNKHVALDA